MLKLEFPNENLFLCDSAIENMLNKGRKKPLNYTLTFDRFGKACYVVREGAFYTISTSLRVCTCKAFEYHRDCKHLHAADALESRVQIVRCPQCDGYGDDDEGECDLCAGWGNLYRVATPQEAVPAGG